MTKRDLQEAYDRMSPSQETKMRMLNNILPQEKGTRKHRARPQEQKRWAVIPAMLALATMLTVCFLLLRPEDSTLPLAEDPTETPVSQPTALPEIPAATVPDGYVHILNKYMTAYNESWTPEQYMQNDISYPLCGMDIFADYGYALMDLDGNGVDELLITDGELIYDLFTLMEDGGPGHILSAGERLRYFLCDDNVIGYRGSSGAANSVLEFYQLKNGMDLIPDIILVYDTDSWFKSEDGNDKLVRITDDEARHIQDFFKAVEIPFQPLLHLETSQEKIFADTYAEALREKIKQNPGIEEMCMSLVDVSGDGVSELLLGTSDSFGQIFTLEGNQMKEVLTYGKDEGFTLCADGIVAYHTPDDPYGQYTFISVKNNQPNVVEEILYDKEVGKWFRYKTMGKEYFKDYQVNDLLASYCPLSVTMIPVADYLAGE